VSIADNLVEESPLSSNFMPESAAIDLFLSDPSSANGLTVMSGFAHALTEARRVTGRDPASGTKTNNALHGSWIGAVGYFALLDQISDCFKPKGAAPVTLNGLRRALAHFSALLPAERDALYALRCAFAHDYSLYNINPRQPSLTHNFQVVQSPSASLVVLPSVAWDGDYKTRNSTNQTTVNLEAFGDLVENIVIKIRSLNQKRDLEILLPDGSDELVSRYMFSSR
jgi:hypothetical protein